ncbi:MAG: YihY/virulence factor BrkB family protein [Haloarculaceae archaeon]
MDTARLLEPAREVLAALRRERLSFLAAALSYYAFVSAVPLLLLAFALASALGGEAFADAVVGVARNPLSEEAAEALDTALTSARGRRGATAVGLLVFVWSGIRLFRGLEHAFGLIYGRTETATSLTQVRNAAVALVAIGLAVTGVGALSWLLPMDQLRLVGLAGTVLSAIAIAAVLLPLYYFLPDPDVSVRECVPGAAVSGGGWALLGAAFSFYTEVAGGFQIYGVLGGVLLFLTWLYFGAVLVLAGAVLNATLAAGTPDRQLQHGAMQSGDNDQP